MAEAGEVAGTVLTARRGGHRLESTPTPIAGSSVLANQRRQAASLESRYAGVRGVIQ